MKDLERCMKKIWSIYTFKNESNETENDSDCLKKKELNESLKRLIGKLRKELEKLRYLGKCSLMLWAISKKWETWIWREVTNFYRETFKETLSSILQSKTSHLTISEIVMIILDRKLRKKNMISPLSFHKPRIS